jgi:RNA polymerase sigma-70 factor (ECF subfamily)
LGQFRGEAQLSTWPTAIVTNSALTQLRRRRRRRGSYLSLEEPKGEDGLTFSETLPDSKPGPEEVCSASEVRDRVVNGISQLSPTLRRAFQLRDIDGLTANEAALVLGVPQGTLRAQLTRARAKLAGTMRQRSPTGSPGEAMPTKDGSQWLGLRPAW